MFSMRRFIALITIAVTCFFSCAKGSPSKECQLMDRDQIRLSSEAIELTIHRSQEFINCPVWLYCLSDLDDNYERIYDVYYDDISKIQTRVYSSFPWISITGVADGMHSDIRNDITLIVEQNTSGASRSCRIVFYTIEKRQTITLSQDSAK